MAEQAVALQQGLWIDQQRLAEAGLRDPYQVSIQSGEIRIRSAELKSASVSAASQDVGHLLNTDAAWDVFRSLGDDAQAGRLADPSVQHDCCLYRAAQ
jgi:hypothetical protein